MKIEDRDIDIVQQLGVVLDRVTGGKEDNVFLLHVFPQEGKK
jgi:hypothetical protein